MHMTFLFIICGSSGPRRHKHVPIMWQRSLTSTGKGYSRRPDGELDHFNKNKETGNGRVNSKILFWSSMVEFVGCASNSSCNERRHPGSHNWGHDTAQTLLKSAGSPGAFKVLSLLFLRGEMPPAVLVAETDRHQQSAVRLRNPALLCFHCRGMEIRPAPLMPPKRLMHARSQQRLFHLSSSTSIAVSGTKAL